MSAEWSCGQDPSPTGLVAALEWGLRQLGGLGDAGVRDLVVAVAELPVADADYKSRLVSDARIRSVPPGVSHTHPLIDVHSPPC